MKLILGTPQGDLFYDEESRILKCVWHGYVGLKIFKEILLAGANICLDKKTVHGVLLDRSDLDDFSDEAKDYLREDFLKNLGQDARQYVHKIATIPPRRFAARTKSKLFNRILRFAYVDLPMQVFESEQKAIAWLKILINKEDEKTDEPIEENEFEDSVMRSVFKLFKSKKGK